MNLYLLVLINRNFNSDYKCSVVAFESGVRWKRLVAAAYCAVRFELTFCDREVTDAEPEGRGMPLERRRKMVG